MYQIEIARIDRTSKWLRADEEERVELIRFGENTVGIFGTWWGERIGVTRDDDSGLIKLDLTGSRSLRDVITGKKADSRFILKLGASSLQLSNDWMLLVNRVR